MSRLFRPVRLVVLLALHRPTTADVISDWNERSYGSAIARSWGPAELRVLAMTDLAMFDAWTITRRRYRAYLMNFVVTGPTLKEAAAASAAAAFLPASIRRPRRRQRRPLLPTFRTRARAEAEWHRAWRGRRCQDARAACRRWRTGAGYLPSAHVPGCNSTVAPQWPGMRPFALKSADQAPQEPPPGI